MKPYYTREAFHVGETRRGETVAIPADVYGTLEAFIRECAIVRNAETVTGAYWCRLSASGYMDRTDWSGPHASLRAAKANIKSTWDVDPDTGDDLTSEGDL